MVADDLQERIALKIFHAEILNDHDAIRREEEAYKPIPAVRKVTQDEARENYMRIKEDIRYIIDDRLTTAKD